MAGPSELDTTLPPPVAIQALLSALPAGVLVTDADDHIVLINEAGKQLMGADALGAYLTNLRGEYQAMLWPTDQGELMLLDAGEELQEATIIGFTSRHYFDARGEPAGSVVTFSDITDTVRRRREREHRRRLADLGQVVATLAHEVRNPVGAIATLSSLLADEGSVQRRPTLSLLVEKIRDETGRLNRLVDDILGFARRRKPQRRPVDMDSLLKTVIDDLRLSEDRRQADERVHIRYQEPGAEILQRARDFSGDRSLLRQVFGNLLRNGVQAVRALENRPIQAEVRVRLAYWEEGLEVIIEDDGVGMPQEELARVFEPFYSTREGGTGLGLAVVERVIRQHSGAISLNSTLGKGSRVLVRLPVDPRTGR